MHKHRAFCRNLSCNRYEDTDVKNGLVNEFELNTSTYQAPKKGVNIKILPETPLLDTSPQGTLTPVNSLCLGPPSLQNTEKSPNKKGLRGPKIHAEILHVFYCALTCTSRNHREFEMYSFPLGWQ